MAAANAASVALIEAGRVLLIRRAFAPLQGLWTLPGGRWEAPETIEETAMREVQEELGLAVRDLVPVMLLPVGAYRLQVFATGRFAGEIVPSPEVDDFGWYAPHQLGDLPTTPRLDEVLTQAFARVGR